jgi:hypothetical protein
MTMVMLSPFWNARDLRPPNVFGARCLAVPSAHSVIQHSASLRGRQFASFTGTISRVLRRPAVRPAPLSFVRSGGTTDRRSSRDSGELLFPAPHRNCAGASIVCLQLTLVETAGSPRFRGNPLRTGAALRLGRLDAPRPLTTHQMLLSVRLTASAPHSVTFRGLITQPVRSLSTLRSSDPLYRTPRKTRFRLAANLDGTGLSPAGLLKEVSTLCFNSQRFRSSWLCWRTNRCDAVTLAMA